MIYGFKGVFSNVYKDGVRVEFVKCLCCNFWRGMLSGYVGGVFSVVGFVYYCYGWKLVLFVIVFVIFIDVSRVVVR